MTIEEVVRKLDDKERETALKRDVKALECLWSDKFTVKAPNNAVVIGKDDVLDAFVSSGIINFSSNGGKTEYILADGDYAFVMRLETLVPKNADAPDLLLGEQSIVVTQTSGKRNPVCSGFSRVAPMSSPRADETGFPQ